MLNSAKIINYLIGDFIHGSSGNPGQLPAAEVLVEDVVGDLLQVLQVGSDEHVAQWHEVAVLHVFDLKNESQQCFRLDWHCQISKFGPMLIVTPRQRSC